MLISSTRTITASFVSSRIWSTDNSEDFQAFQNASEKVEMSLSAGLPGRILANHTPTKIDFAAMSAFPRSSQALEAGLRNGFGFPVFVDQEIVAVIEFLDKEEMRLDPQFENLITQVGIQLGRAFEREQASNKLRQSEARYRALAETASDAIITIDELGTVLYVNPATLRIFGYSSSQLLGHNIVLLMPDYLKELHRKALAAYVHTGLRHMNWHQVALSGVHKEGMELPIELSLAEFLQNDKRLFTGIIRDDVTERKQAQEALEQLSAKVLRLQDEERRKIARELHDSTGQYLAAITMIVETHLKNSNTDEARHLAL